MSQVVGTTKTRLNLREGPGTEYAVLDVLNKDTHLEVLEDLGVWLNVLVGDRLGYVHENYIRVEILEGLPDGGEASEEEGAGVGEPAATTTHVNLRQGPGIEYTVLKALPPGTPIRVLEDLGVWLNVLVDGQVGYVHEDFVRLEGGAEESEPPPDAGSSRRGVTTTHVNLRRGPGTEYSVLETLPPGTGVQVLEDLGVWLNVFVHGQLAYLHEDFVEMEEEDAEETPGVSEEEELDFEGVEGVETRGRAGVETVLREGPGTEFAALETLQPGDGFIVLEDVGDWLNVVAGETLGYVREADVDISLQTTGYATTALNLREGPGTGYQLVLTMPVGAELEILEDLGKWLDVRYRGHRGFVYEDYVRLASGEDAAAGAGTAERRTGSTRSRLNMRSGPGLDRAVLQVLDAGTTFEITAEAGDWYAIELADGADGFVHGNYVRLDQSRAGMAASPGAVADRSPLALPVEEQISVDPGAPWLERLVAGAWNRTGGLLKSLAPRYGIDPAVAVAVLAVESGARGFGPDGRMIIRFENHIFWNYWGKKNRDLFDRHFRFHPGTPWLGHEFRKKSSGNGWIEMHVRSQDVEWMVYENAARFNRTAARMSISMGGPQIMGFNYRSIGFSSVHEMFDAFSESEREQILGFFNFVQGSSQPSSRLRALREKDFQEFARLYNGPGQAQKYGGLIRSVYDIFHRLAG